MNILFKNLCRWKRRKNGENKTMTKTVDHREGVVRKVREPCLDGKGRERWSRVLAGVYQPRLHKEHHLRALADSNAINPPTMVDCKLQTFLTIPQQDFCKFNIAWKARMSQLQHVTKHLR